MNTTAIYTKSSQEKLAQGMATVELQDSVSIDELPLFDAENTRDEILNKYNASVIVSGMWKRRTEADFQARITQLEAQLAAAQEAAPPINVDAAGLNL